MSDALATLVGCKKGELIITRNTTESLDLIIGGFPWVKGDEAIYADQDYGSMKQMFKQVSKRHGIINKVISIPNHPKSDEEIVSKYKNQISKIAPSKIFDETLEEILSMSESDNWLAPETHDLGVVGTETS